MRAFLAGLFIFGATLAVVAMVGANFPDGQWPWWATPLIIATMVGTIVASLYLFNPRGLRPNLTWNTLEERIADLDQAGLVQRSSYRARRAFQVREREDEGLHYFIELDDGRVLYLNGQYLYDYECIEDDPDVNQSRSFPCSEFEVLRHRSEGFVISISCKGELLETELVAPSFDRQDFKAGRVPEDGQILAESYDAIKAERRKANKSPK